ncbi:MAG: DUF1428 domain-containing protein [archaeon]|nr:DUF1428 domain-containing protein [archaeon]
MTYVDGFVLVVPKNKIKDYEKMAQSGGKIWKKYGALEYFECVGDDMTPNMGEMKALTFPELTKLKKGESVWFSFIIYKSKKHRDSVNKKVMAEMSKEMEKHKGKPMPFDVKRMAYGGFKTVVQK